MKLFASAGSTHFFLAVGFVGAFTTVCLAQNDPAKEAQRQANAKFREIVTLAPVREECSGPWELEIISRIKKGQTREDAESALQRNFTTLMSNDARDNDVLLWRYANRVSESMPNFIVCVTKNRALQMQKIETLPPHRTHFHHNNNPMPAHVKASGGTPAGEGEYYRISQTEWSLLKAQDVGRYEEYERTVRERLSGKLGSKAAKATAPDNPAK